MHAELTASPSGLRPDQDQVNGNHGEADPGEIAVGVVIGRTAEFFDFSVYAIASVLVFPKLVFPYCDPVTGTLYSFMIFSLAFITRPIGTFLFMAVDKHYGRGVKLNIAMLLLGASTVAIAFLPGYTDIGAHAAVLLALFRMGQGLALGGTWDGLSPLLAMNAPKGRDGWYAMAPQLGAPLGLIVASGLFAYFVSGLSGDDFLTWGWRYPFFVAFAINILALFARWRIVETPTYQREFEQHELHPAGVRETLRAEGRHVLIGAFAPLASFALFHIVTVFPLSWIVLFTTSKASNFLIIQMVGAAVGVVAMILSGVIADRYGRRHLLTSTALAIAVFSGFAPQLLNQGHTGETVYMILGFALLGLAFGQASGAVASHFSTRYRYTGSALTTDLAWLLGAGFAPLVALVLASQFGLIMVGAYLLSGAVCTLGALALVTQFGTTQH